MKDKISIKEAAEPLAKLRQEFHKNPELSGKERKTVERLKTIIGHFHPDSLKDNIGGNSIAFEFTPEKPQQTIVFRSDMDALPISDDIPADYRSVTPDTGHKCGHDGHMTILTGLAQLISLNPPEKSRVIMLFQAEEETGQGAEKIVNNIWFRDLRPDYVFGLHNLPGFKKNTVVIKEGPFACASVGMKIHLYGKSAHAGQPEDGINPASAVSGLINFINKELDYNALKEFTLATIIHIRIGDAAFGTSPGRADFFLTLRAANEDDLEKLQYLIREKAKDICKKESLTYAFDYTEKFPATINHPEQIQMITQAAKKASLPLLKIEEPFRWSEDFGHYLKHSKGAFFGLGAGENTPRLHNPDYDFPDDIINSGIEMFYNLYLQADKKE